MFYCIWLNNNIGLTDLTRSSFYRATCRNRPSVGGGTVYKDVLHALSTFTLSLEEELDPAPEPLCVRGDSAWRLEKWLFFEWVRSGAGIFSFSHSAGCIQQTPGRFLQVPSCGVGCGCPLSRKLSEAELCDCDCDWRGRVCGSYQILHERRQQESLVRWEEVMLGKWYVWHYNVIKPSLRLLSSLQILP